MFKKGFTIVELLIVIIVLGILAAIILISYRNIAQQASEASVKTNVQNMSKLLEAYAIKNSGTYPSNCLDAGISVASPSSLTCNSTSSTYCLSILNGSISYYATHDNQVGTQGYCSGLNGVAGLPGILSIFAGSGSAGAPIAGPALNSNFNYPFSIAIDKSNNMYVPDYSNHVVEKITPDGTLSIFAGNGGGGTVTPGPAKNTPIAPIAVAVDSLGNVYITDGDRNYIYKVDLSGNLSIFAGIGSASAAVAGPATSSGLRYPRGLAVDSSDNLYIADSQNNVVEKVTPSGVLSIVAGNGGISNGAATSGPALSRNVGYPSGLAFDSSGNMYVSSSYSYCVYKITPAGNLSIFAGLGTAVSYGNPTPGPAVSSRLNPNSQGPVAVDLSGNVYIGSSVYLVKVDTLGKLSIVSGTGSSGMLVAGMASNSSLGTVSGLAFDSNGNLFISDRANNVIAKISL